VRSAIKQGTPVRNELPNRKKGADKEIHLRKGTVGAKCNSAQSCRMQALSIHMCCECAILTQKTRSHLAPPTCSVDVVYVGAQNAVDLDALRRVGYVGGIKVQLTHPRETSRGHKQFVDDNILAGVGGAVQRWTRRPHQQQFGKGYRCIYVRKRRVQPAMFCVGLKRTAGSCPPPSRPMQRDPQHVGCLPGRRPWP